MKIRFYPRSKENVSTVVVSVHHKGKRYFVYTREKVNPTYWLGNRVSSRHPDHAYINSQLSTWEETIKSAMKDLTTDLHVPTQKELSNKITEIIEGPSEAREYLVTWAEGYLDRANKAYGTVQKYRTLTNLLKRYEIDHGRLRFKDIDQKFCKKFREFLSGYSLNYIGSQMKNLKVFMRVSNEELEHGVTVDISPEKEESSQVYLTERELQRLRNLDLSWESIVDHYPGLDNARIAQKMNSLPVIRDRFLLGAYTGLRISDYKRLSDINVDGDFIRIEPRKGGRNMVVIIPIHPVVREILNDIP